MITKHYKSDIEIPVKILLDENGDAYPFKLSFGTNVNKQYIASWDGTTKVNIISEIENGNDIVQVKLDKHGLGLGELMLESTYYLTNADFIGGVKHQVFKGSTEVTLVDNKTDESGIEVIVPVTNDTTTIIQAVDLATNAANLANTAASNADLAAANANNACDSLSGNFIGLEIREDLNLWLIAPDEYEGMTFKVENGNLVPII